jgi:hypothetical protein
MTLIDGLEAFKNTVFRRDYPRWMTFVPSTADARP